MSLIIKQVSAWETSDGVKHTSHSMAVQHVLNAEVLEIFTRNDYSAIDAQDIVNLLTGNMQKLRELFDACDAMEREVMTGRSAK